MEHFYDKVPGWAAFTDLYRDAVRNAKNGDHFVEVGSWLGRSAAFMAVEIINSGKDIAFSCVDPWIDGGPDLRDTQYFKTLNRSPYALFKENVAPVLHIINDIRAFSVDAAKQFEDSSLAFVMLDGDHGYEAVRADIAAWLPKMKPGSVMSGDDYLWPGVKQAAHEAFGDRVVSVIKSGPKANYRNTKSYWSVQL